VAEFFLFGFQVLLGVRAGGDFARYTFDNTYARFLQGVHLVGVVREQTHTEDAEGFQNFRGKGEIPVVRFEAQAFIRLNRVETRVLQFIRLQFGHQADTAPLLLFVNENARPSLGDH